MAERSGWCMSANACVAKWRTPKLESGSDLKRAWVAAQAELQEYQLGKPPQNCRTDRPKTVVEKSAFHSNCGISSKVH